MHLSPANGVKIRGSPSCWAVLTALTQPRRGDRTIAHGVSRGTRAGHRPSPVRGGRSPRTGDVPPPSQVSYAPDGARRDPRSDPTAHAVGYASFARERAGRPYLHAIRGSTPLFFGAARRRQSAFARRRLDAPQEKAREPRMDFDERR